MGKDKETRCSHCNKTGHNLRTCSEKTVKLFGVKISTNVMKKEDLMKKSFSMGNLQAHLKEEDDIDRGYNSDEGPLRSKKDGHERKKGVPWTAQEHRTFLEGLQNLGKGDWRGIAKSYVTTKTPTQVASHAQKYFLRQAAANKKKRRSSLFDMAIDENGETSESAPLKDIAEVPKQTCQSVQVGSPLASHGMQAPPTIPMKRTQSMPNFTGYPYMARMPDRNLFPAMSVVPVVNICNVGYTYQPKPQNSFTAYTPFVSQAYMHPISPPPTPQAVPKVESHGSAAVNTDLNLSIGQPDMGDRVKLPTHTSNMNGAIGVI
ncbi:Transcription factor myb1r1 like [Thalictrum thalictroides]|uniref:Transcription factor myb1r1 like n=1 Tax=Thalictrum thalictroides TaxID=46969 RepID=A0A7J6UUM5_THATH|nr:Transcription factor myb1r1 like [Thalictrum thalictroides]